MLQVLAMSDIHFLPRDYHTPEPFSRPTSSIVLAPTLAPIPGSAVGTPGARVSPNPSPHAKSGGAVKEVELAQALEAVQIEGEVNTGEQPSDSYFGPIPPAPASGATTPGRQRPAIEIPISTPDQPRFSSYPHQVASGSTASPRPIGANDPKKVGHFSLRHPSIRYKLGSRQQPKRNDQSDEEGGVTSDDADSSASHRRRSSSMSIASRGPIAHRTIPRISTHVFGRRRAGSVGARLAAEYHEGDDDAWKQMAKAESERLCPKPTAPFTYQHPADSQHTLQSTTSTIKPTTSPQVNPRRSSLLPIEATLGMIGSEEILESPESLTMPREPPPRRSSLDLSPLTAITPILDFSEQGHIDTGSTLSSSLVSSSVTCSDPSLFSPTTSSQEHPLSSATTSLSRSAKSAKEGTEEYDAALTAVKLQRSLEWEVKQTKRRRRLDKRKMVLLELVETEVAYAEGLRALVQVYLPQLAALPSVSERTASMIARNASELLDFHANLATRMVEVLKADGIAYDIIHDPDVPVERAAGKIALLFIEHLSLFDGYKEFCAGSIAAATLVRHIGLRTDYDSYERRCQIIWSSHSPVTLRDLLAPDSPGREVTNRSRLHFRDYLIMPIQRICRYPLLLSQLRSTAMTPSVETRDSDSDETQAVSVDVETALSHMRQVASAADEARRVKEAEVKSATIIERLEPHVALSPSFIKSLGTCRLIGSLDVLHHHHIIAPLVPPVKVKYLAAFLYRGYLILAKVKRSKVYEAKHFLPLEVFELIDIAEGFLPHSMRLTLRDHNFDLAASCEAEKEVWAAALREARDEGVIPPFEMPASVSPFAAKTRRMSTAAGPMDQLDSPKRFSLDISATGPQEGALDIGHSPAGFGSDMTTRSSGPSTVLLRRPSGNARLHVDRCLYDVFSESCAQARSKAQLSHPLFLPETTSHDMRDRISMRDSTMLRRRTSFLDSRSSSFDIAFHGEVKGSIIPVRQTKSQHGRSRISRPRRSSVGEDSATDLGVSADETITYSDYGPIGHRRTSSGYSTVMSTPATPLPRDDPHRFSMSDIDSSRPSSLDLLTRRPSSYQTLPMRVRDQTPSLSRRKTASSTNLKNKPSQLRTRSMPVSPSESPSISEDPPPLPPKSYPTSTDRPIFSRPISYFPLSTEMGQSSDGLGSSAGLGLIESSMDSDRPRSWQTLRRSMSFLRTGNKADDLSSTSPSSYFSDLPNSSTSLQRPASFASSIGGPVSSSSSVNDPTLNWQGSKSPANKSSDDITLSSGQDGSAPNTPKRKKSLLLTRLRGFTAM